jgi:hypothetical protein
MRQNASISRTVCSSENRARASCADRDSATGRGMRGCGAPCVAAPRDGSATSFRDVDRRIDDAVDERRVGAVLEQPAHEIREQRLVRPHRRVDAARRAQLLSPDHLVVHGFAHAVQALELEAAASPAIGGPRRS